MRTIHVTLQLTHAITFFLLEIITIGNILLDIYLELSITLKNIYLYLICIRLLFF